jgi:hypothetical protein
MKTLTHYITLVLAAAVSADELSFKDSLNEALYAENVTRDLDAAGEGYGRIVDSIRKSGFPAEDRAHAATALFRLAEVHDRQGRDEEAEKLYREFIDRFPDQKHQLALAIAKLGISGPLPRQRLTKVTGTEEGAEDAQLSENVFRDRWHFTRAMKPDELVLTTFQVKHQEGHANEGLPPEFEIKTLHYAPSGKFTKWFSHTQVFWTKEELKKRFEENKNKGRAEWHGNDRRNSVSGFGQTYVVPDDLHHSGGGWGDASMAFFFTDEYSVREDGAGDYVKVEPTKCLTVRLAFQAMSRDRAQRLLAAPLKLELPEMGDEAWSYTLPVSPTEFEGGHNPDEGPSR